MLDFGIAKLAESEGTALTLADAIIGTPAYMSPEQCESRPLDARSDVYSLGCLLYEMLAGQPPFGATGSAASMLMKHVARMPQPPSAIVPDLAPAIDAVVMRALAKSPDERFQTADELAAALAAAIRAHHPAGAAGGTAAGGETAGAQGAAGGTAAGGERGAALSGLPTADGAAGSRDAGTGAPATGTEGGTAAAARPSTRSNLPEHLTSFVGREEEAAEVAALLDGARLLTLTGPGGIGKTRLSLRVAGERLAAYDAVFLVELAPVAVPDLVPNAVAAAVGAVERPGEQTVDMVAETLGASRTLLVLDNCEHVVAACAAIADRLLRACPDLTILASSREALAVAGEQVWRVAGLSLPPAGGPAGDDVRASDSAGGDSAAGRSAVRNSGAGTTARSSTGASWGGSPADAARASEAVRLFVERARLSKSDFDLTDANAGAVSAICRRLDGIPLAIELAAARVRMMSPEQIEQRLADRFRLLTGGGRTGGARQQTLRTAIDSSYDLLDEGERLLFARLSVFAGGWSLEAAEEVCAGGALDALDVLDLLSRLVDKSLVVAEPADGAWRYRFLETLRAYATERLDATPEGAETRARHAEYYCALAESAAPHILGGENHQRWIARLWAENGNLQAALSRSYADPASGDRTARLASTLYRFWMVRSQLSEGNLWLERARERLAGVPDAVRALVIHASGAFAFFHGSYAEANAFFEESLRLRTALGDRPGAAAALNNLGAIAYAWGDYARAADQYEQSTEIFRELGDRTSLAHTLTNVGSIHRNMGAIDKAEAMWEEVLRLSHELELPRVTAQAISDLGIIASDRGDYERAERLASESVARFRELGDRRMATATLANLADAIWHRGDHARATGVFAEAATEFRRRGDMVQLDYLFVSAAGQLVARGRARDGARLAGTVTALSEAIGMAIANVEGGHLARYTAAAREALGDEAFDAAFAEGRAMTADEAIVLVTGGA